MLDLSRLPQAFSEDYRATFFPDSGAFARDLFPKSMEFFEATKHFQNVNIFGSNRSSKSITLAYAAATWALGDYPDWWPGRVFAKPVKIWLCGETGLLVRNNLQRYVMGEKDHEGEHSFIKREDIVGFTYQTRPVGLCERAVIKSKYGGHSVIEFKSYDQGSVRFASDTIDVGILDEEPGTGIYSEVTTRTATTRGLVACGFTSVKGITPLIQTIAPEFCGGDAVDPAVDDRGRRRRDRRRSRQHGFGRLVRCRGRRCFGRGGCRFCVNGLFGRCSRFGRLRRRVGAGRLGLQVGRRVRRRYAAERRLDARGVGRRTRGRRR